MGSVEKSVHYNDWPNAQGFDVTYEERTPVELRVEGTIPIYASGTLFRTGLGQRDVKTDKGNTYKVNHWFDNLALVHRFQIHPPGEPNGAVRVTYNSRSTSDGLIKKIKETGKMDYITFGAKYDPCMSLFQKVQSVFMGAKNDTRKMDELSVSVTMSVNFPGLSKTGSKTSDTYKRGNIQTLCNKSDANVFQMLDPETLEPIGVASQKTLHPDLVGVASATHAKFDPETGDCYNYNLEFAKRKGTYRIFTVSASTAKTSILATITADPAYLHSLFITKNYVILCVWNSVYTCGGIRLLWDKNVADAIAPYDSSRPCKWYVVDRKPVEEGGQGHIATYDSDPFFCFHTINSYEEVGADGKIDIVADLVAYSNLDIIKQFYIDNIISDSKAAAVWAKKTENKGQLRRFTLPGIPTKRISKSAGKFVPPVSKAISGLVGDRDISPELPTLDPRKVLKKHRYVYGVANAGKSTFLDSIVKYDVDTQTAKLWTKHGHTAGEPIFVPNPAENDEDSGVLLSVVLDGILGKSYLLVLDAKDLTELGKAHVDGVIGFGFHGAHVPAMRAEGAERGVIDF